MWQPNLNATFGFVLSEHFPHLRKLPKDMLTISAKDCKASSWQQYDIGHHDLPIVWLEDAMDGIYSLVFIAFL